MSRSIFSPSFQGLLATQFFGAANDNILKGILTFMVIEGGVWEGQLGKGGQGIVALVFTLPFMLFSGFAGQVADRHSKQQVTLWVKIAEIPIAAIAFIGFWVGNLWITLISLIALTIQSAFFGPAKYGMIPEIVDEGQLSRANGTINMMTNLAVIVGTLTAGTISDRYDPKIPAPTQVSSTSSVVSTISFDANSLDVNQPLGSTTQLQASEGIIWLPGTVLLLVAVVGLGTALLIPRLRVGDREVKYSWNPLTVYLDSIKEMAKTRLLMVMLAWGYFYMLAGLALLILPEYTNVLGINRENASVLMGVMGVAIGLGCMAAGFLSGNKIRPQLIPIGAAGLIVFFVLLGMRPSLQMPATTGMLDVASTPESLFVLGAGFFAGFYIVPLQSLLQKLSPDGERGRFLGTANAVSFTFLAVSSLIYWLIRPLFNNPQQIFFVSAALMAAGSAYFLFRLRGTGILLPTGKTPA
jgi:MFS family permease